MAMQNTLNPLSLGVYFQQWCTAKPNRTAILTSNGKEMVQVNYRQLHADTMQWAEFFRAHGVTAGTRVAMISPKNPRHLNFFYACFHLGAIAVPICETLGEKEMAFVIADSSPVFILADKAYVKKATETAEGIPVICLDELPNGVSLDTPNTQPAQIDVDNVAGLIYTSGSTGMPKGVMLTHKNLYCNAYWALQAFDFGYKDSIVSVLPYWHSYALVCECICAIMVSATCIIPKDLRDFRANLANYKPTVLIAVPRVLEMIKLSIDKKIKAASQTQKSLIDKAIYNASRIFTAGPRLDGGILRMLTHHCFYDPLVFRQFRKAFGGKLRFFVVGGAPMDLELQIFFKYLGIPSLVGYGLTETSPVVCANTEPSHRLGTCGKVMGWLLPENGGDFGFKDEDGNITKTGKGALMVKGDCVMKGYWNHTDASAKTMENGWMNTGDTGFCDSEGFINIQGRTGNMIVLIGGEKLHPEHIEDAVKSSPFIQEAMVIGEKCKNVYVCVNVNPDAVKGMSEAEIHDKLKEEMQACTKHLAAYQKPKELLVLPPFTQEDGTLTATLKIRRFKIKELYKKDIEDFLVKNGEEIATKHELGIASSKVLASLEQGEAVVGNGNVVR